MSISPYNSYFIQNREKYVQLLDLDIVEFVAWMDDTLDPAVNVLQLKLIAQELQNKLQSKELTRYVLQAQLPKIIELASRLDKIASQNNTFQLVARHSSTALWHSQARVKQLEAELAASRKAWEGIPE